MALDLVEGPVTKQFRKKWVKIGVIMLFLGLFLQIVFAGIAELLPEAFQQLFINGFGEIFGADGPSSAYRMFIDGGELICIAVLLSWVEGKRRAKAFAKKTILIRRAGMMTLTLYAFQYFALIPIVIINSYIFGYPLADEFQTELWQSIINIIVITLLYAMIPVVWEKAGYKGTFEWFIARLLAKGNPNSGDRLNSQEYLYNVEPLGEPPE